MHLPNFRVNGNIWEQNLSVACLNVEMVVLFFHILSSCGTKWREKKNACAMNSVRIKYERSEKNGIGM